MINKKVLVPAVLIIVGIGVGFTGGYFFRGHQLNKMQNTFANGAAQQRFVGTKGGSQGQVAGSKGGGVVGSVLSMDDKSFTIKLTDGSSKIVLFSDTSTYSNTVSATKADLEVGSEVAIIGTSNSDGSVTATSVQINPQLVRPRGNQVPTAK